jgi:hypothetical protein
VLLQNNEVFSHLMSKLTGHDGFFRHWPSQEQTKVFFPTIAFWHPDDQSAGVTVRMVSPIDKTAGKSESLLRRVGPRHLTHLCRVSLFLFKERTALKME